MGRRRLGARCESRRSTESHQTAETFIELRQRFTQTPEECHGKSWTTEESPSSRDKRRDIKRIFSPSLQRKSEAARDTEQRRVDEPVGGRSPRSQDNAPEGARTHVERQESPPQEGPQEAR